jgi:hypothetical protein
MMGEVLFILDGSRFILCYSNYLFSSVLVFVLQPLFTNKQTLTALLAAS